MHDACCKSQAWPFALELRAALYLTTSWNKCWETAGPWVVMDMSGFINNQCRQVVHSQASLMRLVRQHITVLSFHAARSPTMTTPPNPSLNRVSHESKTSQAPPKKGIAMRAVATLGVRVRPFTCNQALVILQQHLEFD